VSDHRDSAATRYPLNPSQQRTWQHYMQVYHRLEYEMNRRLLADSGLSLGDYTVMNALSQQPGRRARLGALATTIGWERSRLSHHLQRMTRRGLVERQASATDGRATDAVLTAAGWDELRAASPVHAAWVRSAFFGDLDARQTTELGRALGVVYETLLREGTLPRPGQS
jgi:DNA-binding MarR family transcriptional regulator